MATLRQKTAFKSVVSGSTIKSAMISAGYSATTAHRTNKLTRTKGWIQLMEKHLPDSVLAKKHREMLNKTEKIVVSDGNQLGSHIEDTGQPHTDVTRALDMAYKLKGTYKDEGNMNNILVLQLSPESTNRYAVKPVPSDRSE